MWMVLNFKDELEIEVVNMSPTFKHKIKLSWANGMIGAIPVFDTKEAALKYAPEDEIKEISSTSSLPEKPE